MSGRSKILTYGLPAAGLAALIAGGMTVAADRPSRPAETPPRSPTVSPSSAGVSDAQAFIGAIGIAEPAGEAVAIGTHTPGVVEAVLVAPGDTVEAGQALLRIDTRQASALLTQRERSVDVARAELAALEAQAGPARAAVESAEAGVRAAQAGLEAARADAGDQESRLQTAEAIDDPRAISREEVTTRRFALARARGAVAEAEAAVAQARANVAEARARLGLLVDAGSGGAGPDVVAASARLALAEADAASARVELDRLTVKAPAAGTILQVNTRAGEFAATNPQGESLMVFGALGATRIRAQIDEVDIGRFQADAIAWATLRGDPSVRVALRTVLIEPLVVRKRDLTGRTSEVVDTRVLEVVFEPAEALEGLYPGRQVDVYIEAAALSERGAP
jgi:multidrug resistance efflux pump